MDSQLRDLLEAAVGEPPHEVRVEAVRRRVTRHRVKDAAAITACAAVVAAVGVTAATGVSGAAPQFAAGHGPATVYVSYPAHRYSGVLVRIRPGMPGKPIRVGTIGGIAFAPDGKTVYVEAPSGAIIPVSTATGKPGTPIHIRRPGYLPASIWMSPDGKTAYLTFGWHIGSSLSGTIVPIDTATNTAGQPIRVASGSSAFVNDIVFSPDGKTAYVAAGNWTQTPPGALLVNPATIIPVNTVTGATGKPIPVSHGETGITITPDGRTIYAARPGYVTPISTATGAAGQPIRVSTGLGNMSVTPDGKTLYAYGGPTITPISIATNRAGQPIHVAAQEIVFTPDGKTLYAGGPNDSKITPISTATGTPGKPIHVAADSFDITPDGKTLYAAARQGVIPISTATGTPGTTIHPAGYQGMAGIWIAP